MKKTLASVLLTAASLGAAAYLAIPAAAADEAPAPSGWQSEDGKRYYYNADGSKATGEVTIDNIAYLFAPNGVQQRGWQSVGGTRFYYDENGEAKFGWVEWRGETYYVSKTKGKLTGSAATDEGDVYQFDEYGVCELWSKDDEEHWHYGKATGEILIDEQPYLFTEDGVLQTGWQTASDQITRYYDPETHTILTGWITEPDGKITYADPKTGKHTGWLTDDSGKRCYLDAEKGLLTGWQMIDGKQYKLMNDGAVYVGFYSVNDATYLFGTDGVMVTGFYQGDDGTRYFNGNGVMLIGLQEIGDSTYYFNADGLMQTGDQVITNPDGTVSHYTFGEDGKMIAKPTGWQTIDGVKCYILPDGSKAAAPTVIDGKTYLFDASGTLVSGLYTAADGSKYYGDENGCAVTGWQELSNQSSYFDEAGKMAVSTKVDGYTIDANGSARNDRAIKADSYIQKSVKSVNGIYQTFAGTFYYSNVETARTTEQLLAAGWDSLIDPTFSKKRGVCYHLAAALDFTFKRAGITSRIIYAWHNSPHYWVQVLIDDVWWNYDPTYNMQRCQITMEQQNAMDIAKGGTGYTLCGYVDAIYDKKGALVSATYTPIGE